MSYEEYCEMYDKNYDDVRRWNYDDELDEVLLQITTK